MSGPERIWIAEDEIGNPWWSTARDDEMDEYIRADLAPPPAKVKALVEAAKGYRRAIDAFDGTGSMSNKIAVVQGWKSALDAALAALEEQ